MRMTFVLPALLFAGLVAPAMAAAPAQAEHARVIEYTSFLESHPLDARSPAMRAWLLDWEDKSTDVVDMVCDAVLAPLPGKEVDFTGELLAQFVFGSATNQLAHPEQKDNLVANQLAGMRSLLKVYAIVLPLKPHARNPRFDELSEKEANGTLEAYLVPVINTSCKKA
ncbi:hypothetical protein ACXU4B_17760 [Dyella soli]|uniref:Uncharacterized protein n=1 Tax=Dyella soli TaxID=522319 RepID=A0A4R0YE04_9GAMM|nr:hypothetical protein [Dyella soli]TCI06360.1 hypothetical protein EZM97_33265 [Dyella soli]